MKKDRERYYKSFLEEINNLHITKTSYSLDKSEIALTEHLEFNADNFAIPNGNNLILRLNVTNLNDSVPKRVRNREQPFEIKYGYIDSDDLLIKIPPDFLIENLPINQTLDTKFGRYELTVTKLDEHNISYTRILQINRNIYSPEDYSEYRDFQKKIRKMDHLKIVLTKSNKS